MKPDGLADPKVRADVMAEVACAELQVQVAREIILERDQVDQMWPDVTHGKQPITKNLLARYLRSGPLYLLVVEGVDAVAKCLAIKQRIRRHHARGAFANCLHSPSDRIEVESNLHLFGVKAEGLAGRGAVYPVKLLPPIWGRLASLSDDELATVAEQLWQKAVACSWRGLWSDPKISHLTRLVLHQDKRTTLEYAASCLCELFDDMAPIEALSAVWEVERAGRLVLRRGLHAEIGMWAAILAEWGLKVTSEFSGDAHPDCLV
ncbi:hypothetical protein ACIHFD_36175 [Nonomuraea sp. NPDC051941]|uniref:hypothetical protein n=1 Tax=Nonomuraea sp. NPDC051941 TaxID=3364373 RepID=UPI0037C5BA39